MRAIAPTLSLRACRRLHSRKERRQTGRFLVEGIRPVRAALESAHRIELVLYASDLLRGTSGQETVALARARGVACTALSAREFASLSSRENPSGIASVGRQGWRDLDDLTTDAGPIVALHAPQDPGNLGTILRTCDATGCAGVILIGDAVDPWHPAALRAAMGATFEVPLAACDVPAFADWTAGQQGQVVGTSDRAGTDYATHRFERSFVLLMGSERQGLPPALEAIATAMVRIPMAGTVDSLNLAIATALVLYEARNQRVRVAERTQGR
jgi:TrmH family RNA methyltransferase